MNELCEISIKNVCCTCLSTERNLSQLCRIDDGVNNLFFLLSYKSEAYEAVFVKDATMLSMCWECAATLQRLARFREQACVAQATLTDIADGKINYSKIKCLSKLSYSRQTEYNQEAGINVETPENFVDCGPEIVNMKVETPSDCDEVPLTQLRCLKREAAINNDEIDDNYDDYAMSDEDTIDSSVLNKSNNDNTTVKNRDTTTPIIKNKSSINMILEKLVDCFDIVKSKSIKGRQSLADISGDKQLEDKLLYSKPRQEKKYGAKLKVLIDDPQGAGFACAECNKYFKNKKARNKHIQKFHREGYQCPTCGKKFPFSATLRRHELTHLPPEQCSVCGRMVRAKFAKEHAKTHASGKEYACVACDKKFMTRSNYENHLKYARSHADREGLQHKCSVCGKDHRTPAQLRDHYNFVHMGKTHHKCPICDKALATRRSVTMHISRAHSDVKEKARDHICQTCGKGFVHLKVLKQHELIHTGERPLTCDICGRSFRQKAGLYMHRRLVHKVALKKKPVHIDEIIIPDSEINKFSD